LLGAFIGFLVGYLKLNSLIVTLGMLSAIHGLTLTYSGGKNMDIANKDDTWFASSGRAGARHPGADPDLRAVGGGARHGAGQDAVRAKGLCGRRQRTAATFSGIRRARVVFTCYMLSAFCVATAGLIQASRTPGRQNTVGQGLELEVLAAVILGGASLLGGSGTIFKTVIGVLILGFIQNGLLLVGLQFYAQYRRDLDHHHPGGLAGHRHQARQALVADRVRRTDT
jgi:ribose transport system permease protein